MSGFFKVYREIFQHEIFKNELDFRMFMLILGNAIYAEEGVIIEGIHVKRGQWIRSYRMLMKDLEYKQNRGYRQYGIATIKRSIQRLIKNELVTVSDTECGTLYTVVNYEKYQGITPIKETNAERFAEQHRNNIGTTSEQKEEGKKVRNKDPRQYEDDSPFMKMTNYFQEKILEWKPDYLFKGNKETWADDFRKLHEIDNRSKQDIKDVIDWATRDNFWQTNIMSPKKLREKFDTLQGQMNNERNKWNAMKQQKKSNNEPARGNVIEKDIPDSVELLKAMEQQRKKERELMEAT